MSRANIPDLVEWLTGFQPELQDDIDHGSRYVWYNPDLYNTICLLAALDLEKSKLVFDEDRLDQLDY